MYIEQKIKDIPDLQIGDGKEAKQFELKYKFKSLKDWFIGFIIRF